MLARESVFGERIITELKRSESDVVMRSANRVGVSLLDLYFKKI